jgi:hypothetical protein
MTIRTHYFAFLHLSEERAHGTVANRITDVEELLAKMIEL